MRPVPAPCDIRPQLVGGHGQHLGGAAEPERRARWCLRAVHADHGSGMRAEPPRGTTREWKFAARPVSQRRLAGRRRVGDARTGRHRCRRSACDRRRVHTKPQRASGPGRRASAPADVSDGVAESGAAGALHRLGPAADAELREHRSGVVGDGLRGHPEPFSDAVVDRPEASSCSTCRSRVVSSGKGSADRPGPDSAAAPDGRYPARRSLPRRRRRARPGRSPPG